MLTTIAMERNGANMDVSKARLALKLALITVHSHSSEILQQIEDGHDVFIALQTLRSEASEVWAGLESLERALDRLGLVERLAGEIREAV